MRVYASILDNFNLCPGNFNVFSSDSCSFSDFISAFMLQEFTYVDQNLGLDVKFESFK